jgi:alkylation response protein AidB-like acyl-CoA dehydrogenase
VLVYENLARGDVAIAAYLSIHNMVAWMIDTYGTREQRERWVPGLAALDVLGAYCLTEPDAGSDAANIRTTATRDGEEYVLDGMKQFISGAGAAGLYVVMARTGAPGSAGISAFVVEEGTPGLSFGEHERKMGWNAQPTRPVILEGVRVPAGNRLGAEGDGFPIAMKGLNGGRLGIAACSLGGAQWAFERAVSYLATRSAFGGALLDNAALQFRLADMATRLEAARLFLASAAGALDRGDADLVRQCAMAKLFVTDACFEVANEALQLHGGYGYLADYGVEKVVRDLRVHQILEGTNEIMRMIVGREIAAGAA